MLGVIGEESGIEVLFGYSNARVDPSTNEIQWEQWNGCSQVQYCGVPLDSLSQNIPPLKTDDDNITAIVLVFDNRGKSNTFLNKYGTSLQLFKWAQDYFDRRGIERNVSVLFITESYPGPSKLPEVLISRLEVGKSEWKSILNDKLVENYHHRERDDNSLIKILFSLTLRKEKRRYAKRKQQGMFLSVRQIMIIFVLIGFLCYSSPSMIGRVIIVTDEMLGGNIMNAFLIESNCTTIKHQLESLQEKHSKLERDYNSLQIENKSLGKKVKEQGDTLEKVSKRNEELTLQTEKDQGTILTLTGDNRNLKIGNDELEQIIKEMNDDWNRVVEPFCNPALEIHPQVEAYLKDKVTQRNCPNHRHMKL